MPEFDETRIEHRVIGGRPAVVYEAIRYRSPNRRDHRRLSRPRMRVACRRLAGFVGLSVAVYALVVRPRMMDWGASSEERRSRLPGDDVVNDTVSPGMARHTRAVTINAPPEAVWPWLVQIGDRRAGFYSYDWVERATGTVHYVDGKHSATRIHPELQNVQVGDRIATGSIGTRFRIDAPITRVEPGRALVIGTWAFVLVPLPGGRTRLLVRESYPGWIRLAVPPRFGVLRALGGAIDYAFGEPLHFVMERKMMLGLKQRAEHRATPAADDRSRS